MSQFHASESLVPAKFYLKFPASEPCTCKHCLAYCRRPGWWLPYEVCKALEAGFASRMMLEISPEMTFAVLSPAFKGCEGNYAIREMARNGCTFLEQERCLLFGTGLQPAECRFCHHSRKGKGAICHQAIEQLWKSKDAQHLVVRWGNITGFWRKQGFIMVER